MADVTVEYLEDVSVAKVSCPEKSKGTITVQPKGQNSSFFVVTSDYQLPDNLKFNQYTGLQKGIDDAIRYFQSMKVTQTVRRDKNAADRAKRKDDAKQRSHN